MLENLINILETGTNTILFVGIGNVLKTDDGVGVYISQKIKERKNIRNLCVEISIENYIKKINDFKPEVLILVDAVNFNRDPGYCELIPVENLQNITTHTHNISLKKISELFIGKVFILGIQPESVVFGENLTPLVKQTADKIIRRINSN
ncbi:MAG: hydrogenase maturation protease [Bacteroidales bacterium]|nr:hydrogenase maturation protease [Bacteroidales bacterium]